MQLWFLNRGPTAAQARRYLEQVTASSFVLGAMASHLALYSGHNVVAENTQRTAAAHAS
jgi:hypothetical protein